MSYLNAHVITDETLREFYNYLIESEKAEATIKKYLHEICCLKEYLAEEPVTKTKLLQYRQFLRDSNQAKTVNAKLSAINHYLEYYGQMDCKVKLLKIQRKAFINEERELTRSEYCRLLKAAGEKTSERLYYLILTICSTGIRVSEVRFITAEAVCCGKAEICLKGKSRTIIFTKKLIRKLKKYMKQEKITEGPVFRTRSGRSLDRSNICHEMKKLADKIGIAREKVHPHSLRHLFAREFYKIHNNIAHLADILGHSSIETTRIYVAVSAREHMKTLEKMNLII